MKKWGQAVLIFILMMGIAYFKPVLFNRQNSKETASTSTTIKKVENVENQQQKILPCTGFARYIRQDAGQLEKDFGEPTVRYSIADHLEWWQYDKGEEWFQACVDNNKVIAILALGDQSGLKPFMVGTNISVLSAQVVLPTNLTVPYQHEDYRVDLNEDEMQMNPVVRFKNQVYGMMQMDYQGNLAGILYTDPYAFLANMPYTFEKGKAVMNPPVTDTKDLTSFVWNTLAKMHPAARYDESRWLDEQASAALDQFKAKPSSYINDDATYQEWEDVMQSNGSVHDVVMKKSTVRQLIDDCHLSGKTRGILFTTTHQLNWEVVNQYYRYLKNMSDDSAESLHYGIATDGKNVLILMTPMEES